MIPCGLFPDCYANTLHKSNFTDPSTLSVIWRLTGFFSELTAHLGLLGAMAKLRLSGPLSGFTSRVTCQMMGTPLIIVITKRTQRVPLRPKTWMVKWLMAFLVPLLCSEPVCVKLESGLSKQSYTHHSQLTTGPGPGPLSWWARHGMACQQLMWC